jgi:MinD-like ATPase involved in chromosome partitioning or flagellar assembly
LSTDVGVPLCRGALLGDGGRMGHVIAFVPATGGTGATTLAAAVAVRAAAAGRTAVVVDLDRLSGRLDVVLGTEQQVGWRWADLADVSGIVDGRQLLRQLPATRGAAVLGFDGVDGVACVERVAGVDGAGSGRRGTGGVGSGVGRESVEAAYRLEDVDDWLEQACDVVAGLREAVDVVVLDCPRDERVLSALADHVDVVVLTVGTGVAQVASAAAAVPLARRVLDAVRLRSGDLGSGPLVPPFEPWVVLRGRRVDEKLNDLLMDHLDVPVVGAIGDDRHVLSDLAVGRPPGAGGRGPVVDMADRLLLRLVRELDAA